MTSLDAPLGGMSESATLEDLMPSDQPLPDARSIELDQRREVRETLDSMPQGSKEIILLAYFQRLSYQQIAEMLKIPLGTVKSRMHAAVAHFSQRWGDAHREDSGSADASEKTNKGNQRNA